MSELNIPKTWTETDLENLVYLRARIGWKGLKASEYTPEGPLFLSVREINEDGTLTLKKVNHISNERYEESPEIMLKDGDVIISKDGSIGKVAFVEGLKEKATVNSSMAVLTPYEGFLYKFLFHYLKAPSFQSLVKSKIQGAAVPHIFQKDLRKLVVPIPPVLEQERIVNKVDDCYRKVRATEDNLTKVEVLLEKYRKSLLAKAFRGELIPQNSEDEPASVLLSKIREEREKEATSSKKKKVQAFAPVGDDEKPFDIPESWEWVRIGEILTLKHGYAFKGEYYVENGSNLLLTPGNFISEGGFKFQGHKNKFYDGPIDDGFVLKEEDLVLAMTDLTQKPPGILGAPALIPRSEYTILHNQRLGKALANFDLIDKNFLYHYFNTGFYRNEVARTSTGSTVRHTSPTKIYNALIPIPPLNEQRDIAKSLEKFQNFPDIAKANSSRMLETFTRFKEGILVKAFEGRLVEQIESEGTGHELLEKILAKKEAEEVTKKAKKKTNRNVSKKKATKKKVKKKE